MDFIGGFQQPLSQQPMSISIFGGGMPGGGIANFLQPLGNYLRDQVSQEQIDPFIQEVTQMAQERFNLQGGGLQSLPAVGLRVGPFNASLVVPSESKLAEFRDSRKPAVGALSIVNYSGPNQMSSPALPTFGQQARLF